MVHEDQRRSIRLGGEHRIQPGQSLLAERATVLPACLNGSVDAGEQCDDGNTSNADGCLNDCQVATCGDVVENGMQLSDELIVAERFTPEEVNPASGVCRYSLKLQPEWCGRLTYRIRAFPLHRGLTHPHEI